jgi:hypothetical protein
VDVVESGDLQSTISRTTRLRWRPAAARTT